MRVLVLGSAGYIGSALCDELEDCVGFDLKHGQDIRNPSAIIPALEHCDAIVHLAGTVMDPLFTKDPEFTWESNYLANDLISKVLRYTGKRIVYASSGSVYGNQRGEGFCTEETPVAPLTLYAKTKALSEELFLRPDINSVVFRFATAYGLSPNTRFDTVVNSMSKAAKTEGIIKVQGKDKRRSLLHVKDIVQGIKLALEVKQPEHRLYNLGANDQNLTIENLAQIIQQEVGGLITYLSDATGDNRSYFINYDRVKELGFVPKYSIKDGAKEIYGSL